jgi:hypothetical protein
MIDTDDLDRQLREIAHRAFAEMCATPVRRRTFVVPPPRRRLSVAPLAAALAFAAAIAIAAPLVAGHSLRGGTAGRDQPAEVTKPADAVLRDMTDAMSHLRSYHLVERGTASDGSAVLVDLRVDRVGSAMESWTMGGETDSVVIWHGELFAKGPSVIPDSLKTMVGDHWFGLRSPAYAGTLAAAVSPAHIIDCLTGDHGALTKDGVRVVNTVRTLQLASTATSPDTRSFTLDVAIDGPPYAVHMETDAAASPRAECQGPSSPTGDMTATPDRGSTGHEVVLFDSFNSDDLVARPMDVVDNAAIATPAG